MIVIINFWPFCYISYSFRYNMHTSVDNGYENSQSQNGQTNAIKFSCKYCLKTSIFLPFYNFTSSYFSLTYFNSKFSRHKLWEWLFEKIYYLKLLATFDRRQRHIPVSCPTNVQYTIPRFSLSNYPPVSFLPILMH